MTGSSTTHSLWVLIPNQGTSFIDWWNKLNKPEEIRIKKRLIRMRRGNPGDVEPVGSGIFEMRIHFGPGYRIYYFNEGAQQIILLAGGDKSSQKRDIEKAKRMVAAYKNETGQFRRISFPGA